MTRTTKNPVFGVQNNCAALYAITKEIPFSSCSYVVDTNPSAAFALGSAGMLERNDSDQAHHF
jgi:hypothetical protein